MGGNWQYIKKIVGCSDAPSVVHANATNLLEWRERLAGWSASITGYVEFGLLSMLEKCKNARSRFIKSIVKSFGRKGFKSKIGVQRIFTPFAVFKIFNWYFSVLAPPPPLLPRNNF